MMMMLFNFLHDGACRWDFLLHLNNKDLVLVLVRRDSEDTIGLKHVLGFLMSFARL